MRDANPKPVPVLLLAAKIFFLAIAFHVGCAAIGRSLIRPQHLGTALEYARTTIDLLRPQIVGFSANEAPAALEFPAWQAAVASVFKLTGSSWYGWANIVSLAVFGSALWPLLQLFRAYSGGERAACWSLAFFVAQPIVVEMAGEAATDGSCLAAMIWFLFFAHKMVVSGHWGWWLPAAGLACITALFKAPFFMVGGLCGVAMILLHSPKSWRAWLLLSSCGVCAMAVFMMWSAHANFLAREAIYPFTELRLSESSWIVYWYFGDIDQRLNPAVWAKGAWRFLHGTLGALPMGAVLVAGLARSGNELSKLWLGAMFIATLVFTNLVLSHWHYYLMCAPAVAMLCGSTAARWESFWMVEMPPVVLRTSLALGVLGLACVDGLVTMRVGLASDPFYKEVSRVVEENTSPNDRLIVYNFHTIWGGEVLFRSHRRGLIVPCLDGGPGAPTPKGLRDLLCNEDDLRQLKTLGYNKLVLVSESPLQFGVIAVHGRAQNRGHYPTTICPVADAWRTVYASEDLVIKDIQ